MRKKTPDPFFAGSRAKECLKRPRDVSYYLLGRLAPYLGELGSVRDGGADIIEHKGGIVVDDLLRGQSLEQRIENDSDVNSGAANIRSPATNFRVDDHPSQQRTIGHRILQTPVGE